MMYRTCLRSCSKNLSAAIVILFIIACFPAYVPAQSLDDAVTGQLRTIGGVACANLRGSDPLTDLSGGLLAICSRATQSGSSPSAASSGGGAGTPIALPSIVEKRMVLAHSDEEGKKLYIASNAQEPYENIWRLGRWNAFISGEYESLDRDVTSFEDGYDSDIWRFTVGADLQLTRRSLVGIALVKSDQDGDFDGGGNFDVSSFGVVAYGSIMPADKLFIQVSGSYTNKSNDRKRISSFTSDDTTPFSATGSPDADFDADEFDLGLLAGYDFMLGSVTFGPRVGVQWIRTDFDEFSEQGNSGLELTFYEEDVTSLQTSVGVQATSSISTAIGVVSPQAGLAWKHEYQNDQRNPEVSFVGDTRGKRFTYQTEEPDRDFFELNAGLVLVLPHGFQAFGNYRTLFGHSFYTSNAGTLGLRKEF